MIKEILIICGNPSISEQINRSLPENTMVSYAADLATSMMLPNSQFDLIFMDVTTLRGNIAEEFQKAVEHFNSHNPLVRLVSLAPAERVRDAVQVVREGADDYLTYPFDRAEIRLVLKTLQTGIARHLELEYLRNQVWKPDWLEITRTSSPVMGRIFENIQSVAPTIATVLLLGETGTGKGLMARLIHHHSHRCKGPFVVVHCGAIPDTLLESELFGHEKGAFTGAISKKFGRFELAQDGTIFLDEIGTISSAAQIKLLQVLQDGTFTRIGGGDQLKTNARIIAATNADLEKMVAADRFRKDLFYRLNVFPIELPALKNRIEDLPHLINLFMVKLNRKYQRKVNGLHPKTKESMQTYSWPGNLRELENVLERALILETGDVLRPERFPSVLMGNRQMAPAEKEDDALPLSEAKQRAMEAFERRYLANLLSRHKGKINLSACEAKISTRQLSRLAAKYHLDKNAYKP